MPRGRKDRESLDARVHLRCSQRTYDAYKDVADALGLEIAWVMRQVLDAGTPTVEGLVGELTEERGGGLAGLALFQHLLASLRDSGSQAIDVRRDERLALAEQARPQDSHIPLSDSVGAGLSPSEADSRVGTDPPEGRSAS